MDLKKRLGKSQRRKKDSSKGNDDRLQRNKVELPREKYGLFSLNSLPTSEIEVDIVAVHGLGGDWEETWTDPVTDKMWLRDFVPLEWTNARVMSFGYESTFTLTQSVADIDDAASDLLNRLDGERQTPLLQKKPIVFIAHSLGSIVVKRALMLANERSIHWGHLRDQAKYAIFFAVPHRGADLAFWTVLGTNLPDFVPLGLHGNDRFVEGLKRNSSELMGISNGFIQPAGNFSVINTFYETVKMGNQLIVDKDSATLGLSNELAVPVQGANHLEVCRFGNSDGQKYRPIKNALFRISESIKRLEASWTQAYHPKQENWHQTKLETKCLQALRGSRDYEGIKNRSIKRVFNTCLWVLKDRKFLDWQNGSSVGLLWITANPGFGKSVLARSLIDEGLIHSPKSMTCYFFFKEDDENAKRSTEALSVLLYQLFIKHPELIKYALPYSKDLNQLIYSVHNLWDVLKKIMNDVDSPNLIFVIDALDESLDNGTAIIEKLKEFYSQTQSGSPPSFACKLKCLVTSRPYIDIVRQFGSLARGNASVQLSGDDKISLLKEEIELVINNELDLIEESLGLEKDVTKFWKDRLLEMDNRNYLWLHLVLELIKQSVGATTIKGAQKLIEKLPKELDEVYEAILRKTLDRDEASRLLHMVVAAVRPLTVAEMRLAYAIEENTNSYEDMDLERMENFEITIRNQCGLFITISDKRIYLVHNTAKDFLLSSPNSPVSSVKSDIYASWKNSIDPRTSHQILAWACIRYLCFSDFESPQTDSQPLEQGTPNSDIGDNEEPSMSEEHEVDDDAEPKALDSITAVDSRHGDDKIIKGRLQTHQFLEYASSHWLFHIERASPSHKMSRQSLRICDVYSDLCINWFSVLKTKKVRNLDFLKDAFHGSRVDTGVNLAFCTYIGHFLGVQFLLRDLQARNITAQSQLQSEVNDAIRTALYLGIEEGNGIAVQVLLSTFPEMINTELSSTATLTIQDLQGMDVNSETTALRLAVKHRHHSLVPLLLEMNADPNAVGRTTILADAFSCGGLIDELTETVKLLIQYGAKINETGANNGSPLYTAITLSLPKNICRVICDAGGVVTKPRVVENRFDLLFGIGSVLHV